MDSIKEPGFYLDGEGLYLRVTNGSRGTNKSWSFKYQLNGKISEMGLGAYRDISLLEARQMVADNRKLLLQGRDPLAEKNHKKSTIIPTFGECCEEYIQAHKSDWKNVKSESQWRNTLFKDAKKIINLKVNFITSPLILQVLKPIWDTKNATARRLRGRIERVLDHAKSSGYREGDNPATLKGNLEFSLSQKTPKKVHQPSLDWRQLPIFIKELRTKDCLSAIALEFSILTVTRTNEVINAEWSEINLKEARWIIPANRMKAGKEHAIPLSPSAISLLKRVEGMDKRFVFPNKQKPLSNMAMLELVKGMNPYFDKDSKKRIVVHGFRATFRTWASEATNYPPEIIERALAHNNPNKVEAAYLRSHQYQNRIRLMKSYSNLVEGKASPSKIIQFKSAA